jgi:hypothetical protein
MKKIILLISIMLLTGCGNNKLKYLEQNLEKMDLYGNLVTYQAYYHNVIEYEKKAGSGLSHLFEQDRELFIEYKGTIKLGIDLSEVEIKVSGKEINVTIPKAKVIGDPNIDDNFTDKNFIESKDTGINKNPITADDSSAALKQAQDNMRESASKDEKLLKQAQERAKIVLEENIRQVGNLKTGEYTINWNLK